MIDVALKKRSEINIIIDSYIESDTSLRREYLDYDAWQELREIHDFLQPFSEVTLDTQRNNSTLDQVLSSMDFLVTHFRTALD